MCWFSQVVGVQNCVVLKIKCATQQNRRKNEKVFSKNGSIGPRYETKIQKFLSNLDSPEKNYKVGVHLLFFCGAYFTFRLGLSLF